MLLLELGLVVFVGSEFLILLLLALHQIFPFAVLIAKFGLFGQFDSFFVLALGIGDLGFKRLNPGRLILLFFLSALLLSLLIIDLLLKVSDLLDLLHSHSYGASHRLRLFPDLVDLSLALSERLLLLVVGAFKYVVLGLVLLFELTQVLVSDYLVQESLELTFDLLKGIWVEA